jgi:predicted RNA-binding protein YlqC (UPF0109 family)
MSEQQQNLIGLSDFVKYLVTLLVDNHDSVKVTETRSEHGTSIIEVSVDKMDIGKVIGKKGKTIHAIRTLLMSIASRKGGKVSLEVIEPEENN